MRVRTLTDSEALAHAFPLHEAQETTALEAGYPSWAALKVAMTHEPTSAPPTAPTLTRAVPVLAVANVRSSAWG